MKFKKLKYNITCLLLALFVLSAVMLKVYFFDEPIPDSDIIDLPTDSGEPDYNYDDFYYDEDYGDDNGNEVDENLPSTKYQFKFLNYCLSKSASATSYKSELTFSTRTIITVGLSVDTTQNTNATLIKMGNKGLKHITFKCEKIAEAYNPDNNLQIDYWDGSATHSWATPNGVYDINQATYKYSQGGSYYTYFDRFCGGSVIFSDDCGTCAITTQRNNQTKKDEYRVTVTITNPKLAPDNFMRSYSSFSNSINIKSVQQTITFIIDANGYVKSFTQKENYNATSSGADMKMELSYTQTFSGYNTEIEIPHPPIP